MGSPVTNDRSVTTACQHCGALFQQRRADQQFCTTRCRVAAWRKREELLPAIIWEGGTRQLSAVSRSRNADGSLALSNEELGEKLLELARREDNGEPKTGRRFYYLALSHGYVQPDMDASEAAKKSRDAAYSRVLNVLGVLRMNGDLPWGMVLDLTRELVSWETYRSPREARTAMRRSYTEDKWLGQKYYPVFLVEKDTMEPVCKPMAARWQMPFASSRGYSSLTLQHDIAEHLLGRQKRHGQIPLIYFISDHDPSGLDLQRAWEQALVNFGVVAIFWRIALTPEQILNPDLDIERLAINIKPSDSRSQEYIAKHQHLADADGRPRCWEVDVLPADVISEAIDDDIHSWLDVETWNRRIEEIGRAKKLL